jgi:DNA-binding XRE family transcriptional regulator
VDRETRARLEAAGYKIGDAEDFLQLNDAERRMVELRLRVSQLIRERRQTESMTQQQLASKLGSSQSRVAKIEAAASDVSLDLAFKALFATGGTMRDLVTPHKVDTSKSGKTRGRKHRNRMPTEKS